MLLKNLVKDIEVRTGLGKAMQAILAIALLTNVLLAAVILTMDRTVRTIFVPPEITKSFWVDGRKLSAEYLEQMGDWVLYQFATVTPSSVEYKSEQILKYVHPSVYGELAIRFKAGAMRLKQENISRFFFPKEVRISEQSQAVAFIGPQESWIADKRLPGGDMKAYLVVFDWDGSHTTIKELRETDPKHTFEPMTEQALQASILSAQDSVINPAVTRPVVDNPQHHYSQPQPQPEPRNAALPAQPQNSVLPPQPPAAMPNESNTALQEGKLPKDKP